MSTNSRLRQLATRWSSRSDYQCELPKKARRENFVLDMGGHFIVADADADADDSGSGNAGIYNKKPSTSAFASASAKKSNAVNVSARSQTRRSAWYSRSCHVGTDT